MFSCMGASYGQRRLWSPARPIAGYRATPWGSLKLWYTAAPYLPQSNTQVTCDLLVTTFRSQLCNVHQEDGRCLSGT